MLGVALACLVLAPKEIRVLFLGNSHTRLNDVPGMVKLLAETDGANHRLAVSSLIDANLDALARRGESFATLGAGKFDVVVLQGAMVSSSHKYKYSQKSAIDLATAARKAGARVLLYAEWPRRGWDETEYTLDVYRQIAAASKAEIVPVGRVWDRVLAASPKLELWNPDGNHASPSGSYLAACSLYSAICPKGTPTWRPGFVPANVAARILRTARANPPLKVGASGQKKPAS